MIRPSRFFLALHALASAVIAKGVIYYWGHVLMHDGTVVALGCVCTYRRVAFLDVAVAARRAFGDIDRALG